MATCKTCSMWGVLYRCGWLNGYDGQPTLPGITVWSIVSLAGCAEMQGWVMNQSAEVTMNR